MIQGYFYNLFNCLYLRLQVMGASDPTSGTATIAETIRGLGVLMRKGWKPLRTIVLASWDAEEVHISSYNPDCVVTKKLICSMVSLAVRNGVKISQTS